MWLHRLRIRLLALIAGDSLVIINARIPEMAVMLRDGWDQPDDVGMRYYIKSCVSPKPSIRPKADLFHIVPSPDQRKSK